MALSVKETFMYFGYTYAPNLAHQGASVITEISSATLHANGYRNTIMPTTISSLTTLKCIQKAKTMQLGPKIDMRKFTKGSTHTMRSMRGPTKLSEHTMRQVRNCVQENLCTSMNDTFMDLVGPSTTYGLAPNTI
jgi:hypothetical protein